jgi:hypothetical protein
MAQDRPLPFFLPPSLETSCPIRLYCSARCTEEGLIVCWAIRFTPMIPRNYGNAEAKNAQRNEEKVCSDSLGQGQVP